MHALWCMLALVWIFKTLKRKKKPMTQNGHNVRCVWKPRRIYCLRTARYRRFNRRKLYEELLTPFLIFYKLEVCVMLGGVSKQKHTKLKEAINRAEPCLQIVEKKDKKNRGNEFEIYKYLMPFGGKVHSIEPDVAMIIWNICTHLDKVHGSVSTPSEFALFGHTGRHLNGWSAKSAAVYIKNTHKNKARSRHPAWLRHQSAPEAGWQRRGSRCQELPGRVSLSLVTPQPLYSRDGCATRLRTKQ